MLRTFAACYRSATPESSGPCALPAVGVSVLVHAAALGALLMLKPAPDSAPTFETIEITLVPEQRLANARADNGPSVLTSDNSLDASAAPYVPAHRSGVAATASATNWPQSAATGYSFDLPALPSARLPTPNGGIAALAAMLHCPASSSSIRGARTHEPCISAARSDDPFAYAPVLTQLPLYAPQPNKTGSESDYRTFTQGQSVVDESLFPDEIPPANRDLESWIARLLR